MKYLIIHQSFEQNQLGMFGEVDGKEGDVDWGFQRALERIFTRHNADDRPDRFMRPSLSVGDIVVLFYEREPMKFTVEPVGWRRTLARTPFEDTIAAVMQYG